LVQCTQSDGALLVALVHWADIRALFGQFLFLDDRMRIKASVANNFPHHALMDVVFLQPDTGIYPRRWPQTERPALHADTLRLKNMWSTAIENLQENMFMLHHLTMIIMNG